MERVEREQKRLRKNSKKNKKNRKKLLTNSEKSCIIKVQRVRETETLSKVKKVGRNFIARKRSVMTKREAFEAVINGKINEEVIEVMEKELANLEKRSVREAEKRAEKAKADAPIVEAIKNALSTDTYKSATEIAETVSAVLGEKVTTSKVSAVFRKVDFVKAVDGKEIGEGNRKMYKLAE